MKKLLFLLLMGIVTATGFSQITDASFYQRKQLGPGANWLFDYDTVRINRLHIEDRTGFDSLGRMFYYNNVVPATGSMLKGNGTYFDNFARGSAAQVLRVNAGGTDLEWWTPTLGPGSVTGLTADLFLFGKSDGTIDQDAYGYYDKVNHYLRLGDPAGLAAVPGGEFAVVDGTNASSMTASGMGVSTASGQTYFDGLYYRFLDLDGDAFALGRVPYSSDMTLLFPSAVGSANQILKVGSVVGDVVNLTWASDALGTVTSIATTSPITGGTITSTGTIGINNADADGATKGAASFTANDFNASSGNISIDYTSGQAAATGTKGFLTSTDWNTFNKKTGLVQAPTELTAQTASLAATTFYTAPAADGWYRITITATVTTAAGTSLDLAAQLRYTEATDNLAKTYPNTNVNGMNRTQTNTTAASISITSVCHVKASTALQYITTFSFVGGAPQYNLHATVEKLDF